MKRIAYKFILRILLHLPPFVEKALFAIAYPIYAALHKKRAWGRVQKWLSQTGMDKKTTPKEVFRALYANYLFCLRYLCRMPKALQSVRFENEEIIREPLKKGVPVAAISIHQGPFEILHRSLTRYSDHVYLFTHSFPDKALTDLLHEIRSTDGLEERETETVAKTLREFFKNRGVLAMLIDQATEGRGNRATLLGLSSELFLRLPLKVMSMGAGIVTFRTFRNGCGYTVRFESYYPPKSPEEKVSGRIAEEVSEWIAEHPAEWTWNYHRNFSVQSR